MAHRTAIEALADNQGVLGTKYGLAFHHTCQALWRVSSSWDRYQALFSTQERVELLNRSGGNFWCAIQDMMFEDVLLGLCRLTDPAKMGQNENLSINTLVELDTSKHKSRLRQRAKLATKKANFARTWRDKRIAHNDFEQITELANKLAPATGVKITNTIISIHDVLRWINARHFGGDMGLLDMGDRDAIEVMAVIADGLRYDELRETDYEVGNMRSIYDRRLDWMADGPDPMKRYEKRDRLKLPKPLNTLSRQ